MKKIFNYFFACVLILTSTSLFSYKENEVWWEKCLENEISLTTFGDWLGSINADSRVVMRSHLAKKSYRSILDVPCGLCVDYWGIMNEKIPISYTGVDVTPKLVSLAKMSNIPVMEGNIEDLPFSDNSFDISYGRHILEHLENYEKAIDELIRVAEKEVLIVFFIKPTNADTDEISPALINGYLLYHNIYSKPKLEEYLLANPKVKQLEWEEVNANELILHIYL